MNNQFLHKHQNFSQLIDIVSKEMKINDSALVEKDYWIMHVLFCLSKLNLKFELKGGTSLSKGFDIIHRFSEDIDIRIDPEKSITGFDVYTGKNHDKPKQCESRRLYYDWLSEFLKTNLSEDLTVARDTNFDDETGKFRNGGIRLYYSSTFKTPVGLKEGILLEVGFDKTAPNIECDISSWIYDRAVKSQVQIEDNRAIKIPCYEFKYTFVEKLQAVIRKFRLYKENPGNGIPANFLRHYYDVYQLLDKEEVRNFIGTPEYLEFKKERFKSDDVIVKNSDAFYLRDKNIKSLFEKEYSKTQTLYFKGQPTLDELLSRISMYIDRL